MRKNVIAVAVVALGVFIATNVYAASRKYVPDLGDNTARGYNDIYCRDGKAIGVAYFDLDNDSMDAPALICIDKNKYTHIVKPSNEDWPGNTREVQEHKCRDYEEFVGLRYKDRDVTGAHKDAADGVSVACRDKKTKRIRYTYNPDLLGGREWTTVVAQPGETVVGISYKDGGCGKKGDCTDAVTILTVPTGKRARRR